MLLWVPDPSQDGLTLGWRTEWEMLERKQELLATRFSKAHPSCNQPSGIVSSKAVSLEPCKEAMGQ